MKQELMLSECLNLDKLGETNASAAIEQPIEIT